MITPLPQELLRRVPDGHTFHRWTGTVEYVRTQTGSGQRNFILHPIPGEEDAKLNVNGYMGVTDLAIEQFNGHRIVLFGFVFEKGDLGFCFAYSRGTEAWLMCHDMHKVLYIFKPKGAKQSAKVFAALFQTIAGPGSSTVLPIDPLTGKSMGGQAIHALLMDIRAYLQANMGPAQDTNARL